MTRPRVVSGVDAIWRGAVVLVDQVDGLDLVTAVEAVCEHAERGGEVGRVAAAEVRAEMLGVCASLVDAEARASWIRARAGVVW